MNPPDMTFANGDLIPALGLGTWKSAPGEVGEAIHSAILAGYRHFDCAPVYGNEREIGAAFSRAFDEGLVTRGELHVTSKLWCDKHEKQHVVPALEQTLADLQLDYLDLYLIHWPIALRHGVNFPEKTDDFLTPAEAPLTGTWEGMEDCVEKGLARHIGVSNFNPARLEALLATARLKPEVNQVECHPFLSQPELLEICQNHGMILTAYSPLGSGQQHQAGVSNIFDDSTLARIAAAHLATPAQIALAWAICRGTVTIPKSVHTARLQENFAAAAIILTPQEIREIDALNQGLRHLEGALWTENGSPYSLDWLWQDGALG